MPTDDEKRTIGRDMGLAAALIATGALIAGISLATLVARAPQQTAQAQISPAPQESSKPAESKPGGTRPTTPAPEPARPSPQAQQEGAKPALPPAPAEKIAPPINPPAKEK
jgi:hypothetical protein